jgi:hypothetical protein
MAIELLDKVFIIFITLDHVLMNYNSEPSAVEHAL